MLLIWKKEVTLTGAGRTDAGVHAAEYYAHFDLSENIPQVSLDKFVFKLNSYLSPEMAIQRIFPVTPSLQARFSATSRTYKYYVSRFKSPFRKDYSYFVFGDLNVALMNEGARLIMETDDFTSFSKVGTDTKTNLCRVTSAHWEYEGDELVFTITANRFLRNMVRAIVGTLLNLGRHKIDLDDLLRIIGSQNRCDAGDSAPARGLHLVKIEYPEGAFNFTPF
jgi:tRNA pseudouridine38-40 synthase